MSTLPALVGFQVPQMNLGDTYTQMAKLAAYDQARRTSLLEQEEKRGKLDRESQVRQLLASALQPQAPVPGQGFAAAPPQATAAVPAPPPPVTAGSPYETIPNTPEGRLAVAQGTMPPVGVPVPVNTQNGVWGQPGGFTAAQPPAIAAMAPPVDTSQPPLQGGGFTVAPTQAPVAAGGLTAAQPAQAPAPQTGFAAQQPTRPLSASVPGLLPLPDMQKVQQAVAIDPTYTSQWLGAYLTQRGKQLDEIDRNNKLVYQVTGAMLEHPEYYQEGLDYLREQGVPVPKNMPPTYNAALVNFHHKVAQERMSPLDAEKVKTQQLINQLIPQAQRAMQTPGGEASAPAAGGAGAEAGAGGGAAAGSGQPVIDKALADNSRLFNVRLPLLQGIARHESNYDAGAVSPKGATGVMQLMPGTAKDMGVENPKDPVQNIRGGTRYFAQLLTKYNGNEALALAAYNWGPGNVDKVGGDLTKMPAETQAYVKNVLATAASDQRGPAGTQGQVAGPGAPAPATTSPTPEVRRIEQQMAESQRKIDALKPLVLADPTRFNAALDNEQKTLDSLRAQRNLLTEPQRAGQRVRAEEQARYGEKQQQQAGPMLPEDRRKLLTGLRTDIRAEPTFKTYQEVRNGFQNVQIGAESNNAIGDLAIVNGIAKIFDPGSAVLRGEAQTVEQAQGMLQVIMNSPQRFFEGDRLTVPGRQAILALAQQLARRKLTTAEKELRSVYEPLAKEGNIQFSQLLPLEEIPAPTSGGTTSGGTTSGGTTVSPTVKEDLLQKHTR